MTKYGNRHSVEKKHITMTNTEIQQLLKGNNPLRDWPGKFFAMWIASITPVVLLMLSVMVLMPLDLQNNFNLVVALLVLFTIIMYLHTRKFWLLEKRTWWQNFKTYGTFWMIILLVSIFAVITSRWLGIS